MNGVCANIVEKILRVRHNHQNVRIRGEIIFQPHTCLLMTTMNERNLKKIMCW